MITINGVAHPTKRPANLNDQLIASTGHGAAEIELLLVSGPDRMARAVLPFLGEDAPPLNELARAIAADRVAAEAIRALYETVPETAVPAVGDAKGASK